MFRFWKFRLSIYCVYGTIFRAFWMQILQQYIFSSSLYVSLKSAWNICLPHKTNHQPISSVPSDSAFRIQGHYLSVSPCSFYFLPFSFSLPLTLSVFLSFSFLFSFFLSWNRTNASLCAMLIFWPADKVWDWEIYACGCADAGAEGEKSDRRDQMQEHDNAWNAAPWARKLMAERRLSLLEQPLRPRYGAQMVRER